jgi:hypothetical protein
VFLCFRSPRASLRFFGIDSAAFVAFLNVFGLAFLLVRVTQLVSARHARLPCPALRTRNAAHEPRFLRKRIDGALRSMSRQLTVERTSSIPQPTAPISGLQFSNCDENEYELVAAEPWTARLFTLSILRHSSVFRCWHQFRLVYFPALNTFPSLRRQWAESSQVSRYCPCSFGLTRISPYFKKRRASQWNNQCEIGADRSCQLWRL